MRLTWRRVDVTIPPAGGVGHRTIWRAGALITLSDGGYEGRGEASPLPGFSLETLSQVCEVLIKCKGEAPVEVPPSLPSLAFALEAARLDLQGRTRGVPVWRMLGGTSGSGLGLSRVLTGATPDEVEGQARHAVAKGFAAVKLKLDGADLDEGLARAAAARRGAPSLRLRLDFNRSLPDADLPRLAALAPLDPEFVEEPCMSGALAIDHSPVPIAADESLLEPGADEALDKALRTGRLAAVVLKPALLGGLTRCVELAARAAKLGVPSVVTHLHDGPVARAAAAALALAIPNTAPAGLDTYAGFERWPIAPTAFAGPTRLAHAPAPGLGFA